MRKTFQATVAAALVSGLFAAGSGADVVKLKGGAVLQGTVLKRDDKTVWLDVGPRVLAFSVDDIHEVVTEAGDIASETVAESVYHTARMNPAKITLVRANAVSSA